MIKTILFDFDGTLFDTGEGILRSVQYALEGFGIHETDTARLRKFVGPPLLDSFSELYAMTPEQAQAAVARYRERYLPVGIYECTLYPGIPELLERLRAHGFRVAVATGKPTPMARSILQRFDLERLFDCVIGCEYDGTRSTKAEVVAAALAGTQTAPRRRSWSATESMTSPAPLPAVCRVSACTTAMQSRVSWRPPVRRQWCRPSQSWASGCCTGTRHDAKTPCGI